jgi:hypothetical protein
MIFQSGLARSKIRAKYTFWPKSSYDFSCRHNLTRFFFSDFDYLLILSKINKVLLHKDKIACGLINL